jgi:hypothetical protein
MKSASWLMLVLGLVLFLAGMTCWLTDKRNPEWKADIVVTALIPGCALSTMGWAGACALVGRR